MVGNKINILSIITVPDPILRKKSKDIGLSKIKTENFKSLIKDMAFLMEEHKGIGLSAVQVGILENFFIIKKNVDKEGIENVFEDIEVYINPRILEYSSEKTELWEGCLSIPGIECLVERSKKIKAQYIDINGNELQREFDDFKSIVFQHEYDHTKGILIIDRAKHIRKVTSEKR